MQVEISNHPFFTEVKRKLIFNPLNIDYTARTANWGFNIVHFDAAGNDITNHLPSVQGNFSINNSRKVDSKTGIKIPADAAENVLAAGVPEFEFLNGMLKLKDVDPTVLGIQRVMMSDSRGAFNDYSKLMEL
jgi:hypothetical protein